MQTFKITRNLANDLAKGFSHNGTDIILAFGSYEGGLYLHSEGGLAPFGNSTITFKNGKKAELVGHFCSTIKGVFHLYIDGLLGDQELEALAIFALENGKFKGHYDVEDGKVAFHLEITISKTPAAPKAPKAKAAKVEEVEENSSAPIPITAQNAQEVAQAFHTENGLTFDVSPAPKAQECGIPFKFILKMAKIPVKTLRIFSILEHSPKKLISWIGGKHYLAQDIIARLPRHRLYGEPFAGGLSVFFSKPKSRLEVINDLNGDLINFYRCVKHHPHTLLEYIHAHPINREWFENDLKEPTNNKIERAARWYLRVRLSYRSTTKGFCTGTSPIANRCNLTAIERVKNANFTRFSQRFKGVLIENMDAVDLVQKYDAPDALFYCDPPYVGTEVQYAKHFGTQICDQLHVRLSHALKALKGRFVLSYNDCEAVRDLYAWAHIAPVHTTYVLKRTPNIQRQTQEVLISNFKTSLF